MINHDESFPALSTTAWINFTPSTPSSILGKSKSSAVSFTPLIVFKMAPRYVL